MGKDLFNDRISRFSIRKLNVGVCSVLLGTLVMVGTASQVSADETANQVQAGDVTSTTATVSDESSSQTAVAAQASTEVANILSSTETNSQSQTVSNASSATSKHRQHKLLVKQHLKQLRQRQQVLQHLPLVLLALQV